MAAGHRCNHPVRRGPGGDEGLYLEVFGPLLHREDPNSAVFMFGDTAINLLDITQGDELIAPGAVAPREAGSRMVFTLVVDDVDAMCDTLRARGVDLLNDAMDRSWSIRTASFRDPSGHIWEIAKTRRILMGRPPPSNVHWVVHGGEHGQVANTHSLLSCSRSLSRS